MRLAPTFMTILAVVLLIGVAGTPLAATAVIPTIPRDHYKIYDLSPLVEIQVPDLTLRDQFGTSEVRAIGPVHFGVPISKNGEPVFDPFLHYNWYRISTPEPGRTVVYENQFGENVVFVKDGIYLLTGTPKNADQSQGPILAEADHFKCYEAFGDPVEITALLDSDQFGGEDVIVGRPELFCNPAEKTLPDGRMFPPANDIDHLVCYRIEPQRPLGATITYFDQFFFGQGTLFDNRWLCVPSIKTGVTQTEQSSWGKLKSIYR